MRRAQKVLILALGSTILVAAVTEWLAGAFILWLQGADPRGATLATYSAYWQTNSAVASHRFEAYAVFVVALAMVLVAPVWVYGATRRRARPLYGAAAFARTDEIRASGLLGEQGIVVGKHGGRYLMFAGQQFVLLAAPTRSGKGVGVVIPNLLQFPDSVVVLDIKQENFDVTAGFRARCGHAVYLFNPFAEDLRTHRYNPLDEVSEDLRFRAGDILSIGYVLYPDRGAESFWNDHARNLFVGLALYVCETPGVPRTFGEILRQSSGYGAPVRTYLLRLMMPPATESRKLSAPCRDALARFLANGDATFPGILAAFNAPLMIWANPIVDVATSASDFSLTQVRRQRMSIYLGIAPNRLGEAAVLVNLFFSQLVHLNTRERPERDPTLRYQCLLVMDEFAAMGKVDIIARAMPFLAGYNLRLLTIIQSIAQLASVYGELVARTLMTNHALQVVFAPREQRDAEEYSQMLGTLTEDVASVSQTRSHTGLHQSRSRSWRSTGQKRPLMLPQELKNMGADREVILLENCAPLLAEKIRYYEDRRYRARVLPAPEVAPLSIEAAVAAPGH